MAVFKMNKILIVVPGLNVGGVDSSLINFCNRYSNSFEITLFIFGASAPLLPLIPKNVKLIETTRRLKILTTSRKNIIKQFGIWSFITKSFFYFFSRIFGNSFAQRFFTSTLKKDNKIVYDFAIAWSNDGNERTLCFGSEYIVLNKFLAKKRILYMHNDYFKNKIEGPSNNRRLNKFDAVWCVSKGVLDSVYKIIDDKNKATVCHCFVDTSIIIKKSQEMTPQLLKGGIKFITVCRLSQEKGIDRGIQIFAKIHELVKKPFCWYIIGSGDDRYEKMATKMNCLSYIVFLGEKTNPLPFVKASDVYLSLSRFEGAPISILEAKTLDKKIIASDYISAQEQLGEGDIILPNDDKELEKGLIAFLNNPKLDSKGFMDVQKWNEEADNEIRKQLSK